MDGIDSGEVETVQYFGFGGPLKPPRSVFLFAVAFNGYIQRDVQCNRDASHLQCELGE